MPASKSITPRRFAKQNTEGQADIKSTKRIKSEGSSKTARQVSGPKIDVFDVKGKVVESIALPPSIFAAKENPTLVAQAVRVYLANKRQGTASVKSRGEISASKKKVWRQKGTGRARHGAKSAPIFVGGGVAFGPKPRSFSLDLSQKMRRAALFSVLTTRLKNQNITVISGMETIGPKTKKALEVLKNLALEPSKESVVVITDGTSKNVFRAARNIEGVELIPALQLNAYDASRGSKLLFMKNAIDILQSHFMKKEKTV